MKEDLSFIKKLKPKTVKYAIEEKLAPENEVFLRATTAESSPTTSGTVTPKVHASDEALIQAPAKFDVDIDPWALPEIVQQDDAKRWADHSGGEKCCTMLRCFLRLVCLLGLLYVFICSLGLLSDAFRLLGGRAAGEVFKESDVLRNPVCGLMIGVLSTVLLQSSSTSTSILVSMVAANKMKKVKKNEVALSQVPPNPKVDAFLSQPVIDVRTGIPIVMGANIGTSITNTLVSIAHAGRRAEFRRAFAGATVHDMFNWLTVLVLLPTEVLTGYLYSLTGAIIHSMNLDDTAERKKEPPEVLKVLTEPITKRIVQLDKHVIMQIATGQLHNSTEPVELMKRYCGPKALANLTVEAEKVKCGHLFALIGLNDFSSGLILLIISLALLIFCLLGLVKLLKSVLGGQIASAIRRTVNADLPRPFHFLTGYLTILIGAFLTILVQSSSVFTSTLTPLVAIGVLSLDRMYPLTLGSNVGTTFTSILAALASPAQTLPSALQMALCHLFFNVTGILIFYPIPVMRQCPIGLAKILGETTAKYRWFGFVYIMAAFFLIPAAVFGLSLGGPTVFLAVGAPIGTIFGIIIIINLLQAKLPKVLPQFLHNWDFLPEWLHSLDPYDRFMVAMCQKCCPCWASYVSPPKSATPSLAPSAATSRANLRDAGKHADSKERLPPVSPIPLV